MSAEDAIKIMRNALQRIAKAQADRLDHAVDVSIIERAARIAREALESTDGVSLDAAIKAMPRYTTPLLDEAAAGADLPDGGQHGER